MGWTIDIQVLNKMGWTFSVLFSQRRVGFVTWFNVKGSNPNIHNSSAKLHL